MFYPRLGAMPGRMGDRRGLQVALAVVAIAVVALAGVLIGANLADDDPSSVDTPPSTAGGASTTERTTSTTATPVQVGDDAAEVAIWPIPSTSQRFDDPAAAARSFAVELAGFPENVVVGDLREGDSRSGEVELRTTEQGPVTTVLVRQLGDDESWWVLGAQTDNIVLDDPSAGDTVSSPLSVEGRARAFEGNVEVELRADGQLEPIGGTFATGGSDALRPFSAEVEFPAPGVEGGVLMLLSRSAEDGAVMEATVVRVHFAG